MDRVQQWVWSVVVAIALVAAPTARAVGPAIGDPAPTGLGKDRKGAAVDLSDYRGRIVVVSFWASWCGFCLKELPVLNDLQLAIGPEVLAVIAVNVKDDSEDYRTMMRQMRGYQLVQARDREGTFAEAYGVNAYPNLWILDADGRVAAHHVGYGEKTLVSIVTDIHRLATAARPRPVASRPAVPVSIAAPAP